MSKLKIPVATINLNHSNPCSLDGQQCHILQQPPAISGSKAMDLLLSFGVGKVNYFNIYIIKHPGMFPSD